MESTEKAVSNVLESYEKNEFLKIWDGAGTHEEKMAATYFRAMQPDCFEHYKPRFSPVPPRGWMEEYGIYATAKPSEKSEIWKDITFRFSGYLKACYEVKAENESDKKFLKDMMEYFEKIGMLSYAEKCREMLQGFEMVMA